MTTHTLPKRVSSKYERGQAIVLIALAMVAVVAIVGLMVDGGTLLLEYDKLKRAVDAAAISGSLQFREGYTIVELEDSAREFLILNQVNIDQVTIVVETCDSNPTDPELCTTPPRKLVRVTATQDLEFGFLRVLGIDGTPITTSAIGEAASVDLVLVLDASQSMAAEGGNYPNHYDPSDYATYGDPSRNDTEADHPSVCNAANACHPFKEIKDAAIALIQQLFFPYDRVAIVTFDRNPHVWVTLSDTDGMTAIQAETALVTAIGGLTVFEPVPCDPSPDPATTTHCLWDPPAPGVVEGFFEYPMWRASQAVNPPTGDPSSRPTSNIGAGLGVAGEQFGAAREDSLWVVVALAGGPTNTGCTHTTGSYLTDCDGKYVTSQGRICPSDTWSPLRCRDLLAQSRHTDVDAAYDSDDYARDIADWLADPDEVGAVVFTIGLGDLVTNNENEETDVAGLSQVCAGSSAYNQPGAAGERLLCYIAEQAGGATANHGTYHFAPDATGLQQIFLEIADNIAIRLSR
ncbi:MAG: pilus assembly protein TadG-related protein [Chloroflexota bacterium]